MKKRALKLSIPVIMLLNVSYLQANTIKEVVEYTMSNNPKVISTLKNNEAYRLYIDEAKGGYAPKLDLTAYIGAKKTKSNPDNGNKTTSNTNGYNGQLDFEQLIYDGGLTTGEIDEAQFRYNSNKYLNDSIVDDIIYDSVDSYLNLVKYKNRLTISEQSLAIYQNYLTTAIETEEISGEALQKAQVNAKIHYANNILYENTNNNLKSVSAFKKNVGINPDGQSCRPNLDNTKVPSTLKELVDNLLVKNPLILEQVENIKEQRAILNQKDSAFYPTLKFKAQAIYDKDLLSEDEISEIYNAKIELTYNIFNGDKDNSASIREKIFLEEAQKNLDTVTKSVVEETTNAYNTYKYSKKRVNELELYIEDNENILSIYKDQFEGGTRTFIDVLNIERDLVSAKQDLIDAQYELDSSYFQIFNNLGTIKESILNSNNDTCTETKIQKKALSSAANTTSDDVQALLAEDANSSNNQVSEAMDVNTTVYALYLVSYKNSNMAEEDLIKAKDLLGESFLVKTEKSSTYNSVVVYDITSINEANNIKNRLEKSFPGSYIRKFAK